MFDSVDIANINCAVKRVGEKAANRSWNLIKKELAELPKTPTNISRDVILSELNSALGDVLTKNNDTAADTINRLMIKLTPVD